MSTLETLGLFVGVPAAMFIVIALLCTAPSWGRDPRYRPGLTWTADPSWIGGPEDDGPQAIEGGAAAEADVAASRTGGASASW